MSSNLKEWRKIYDTVYKFGKMLKDSRPTIDEKKVCHPAIAPISLETQRIIEEEIEKLIVKCKFYLDAIGLRMPAPLWHYDKDDPKTWASDPSFKFGHLLNK